MEWEEEEKEEDSSKACNVDCKRNKGEGAFDNREGEGGGRRGEIRNDRLERFPEERLAQR